MLILAKVFLFGHGSVSFGCDGGVLVGWSGIVIGGLDEVRRCSGSSEADGSVKLSSVATLTHSL